MGEVVQVQDITKTYGKKGEKQYQALKASALMWHVANSLGSWGLLAQVKQLY